MSNGTGKSTSAESAASVERTDGPTTQELFDVLSNRRRRYALHALDRDDETTIGSLADQVAAWENDHPVDEVTATERKRVYTALQQSHLPKLDRTGLAEFDPDTGRVVPTDAADEVDARFGLDDDDEAVPWWRYHLALSSVALVATLGVWFGVPPFPALPPAVWLTVVTALFSLSAVAHAFLSTDGLGASGGPGESTGPPERTRDSRA
ncbi:DUF7344 domain-containing protein [Haloplanus salilacus]|uniref:DUF7344 domain-containing protein n=1 Tax=Haloplanus salilacus TaxID=2949994 RepID=UPI0030D1B48D